MDKKNKKNIVNEKYILCNVYLLNDKNPKFKPGRVSKQMHIADRHTYFMCKFPVFEIFEVKRWWTRSRTVQGQTVFSKYLISDFNDLELIAFRVIWGQSLWCLSKAMFDLSDVL